MKNLLEWVLIIGLFYVLTNGPTKTATELHNAWEALLGHPAVVEAKQPTTPPKPEPTFKKE